MFKKKLVIGLLTAVSLSGLLLLSNTALAQATPNQLLPSNESTLQNNLLEDSPRISRSKASELAQDRFDGRVLNIRLEKDRWRVRMDDEGTVFNVYVNAQSGEIQNQEQ